MRKLPIIANVQSQVGRSSDKPDLVVTCVPATAAELDKMTFKGSFQSKPFYEPVSMNSTDFHEIWRNRELVESSMGGF